jgi:hypothetical protein
MSAIWKSSGRAGGMYRQHAAGVIIDDNTHRVIKDRAERKPGRQATELEIAKANINKADDQMWLDRRRAFNRKWLTLPKESHDSQEN